MAVNSIIQQKEDVMKRRIKMLEAELSIERAKVIMYEASHNSTPTYIINPASLADYKREIVYTDLQNHIHPSLTPRKDKNEKLKKDEKEEKTIDKEQKGKKDNNSKEEMYKNSEPSHWLTNQTLIDKLKKEQHERQQQQSQKKERKKKVESALREENRNKRQTQSLPATVAILPAKRKATNEADKQTRAEAIRAKYNNKQQDKENIIPMSV